ncbi:MAG: type B 50S ribosomal protein L31 [Chlamydiia bacterium]
MKKGKHPEYQDVLFVDSATGHKFICGSTLKPTKRDTFEGKDYPACFVSISSASHPFFTGSKQFVDAERRIDRFVGKYAAKAASAKAAVQPKAPAKPVFKKPAPKSKVAK